ncbi:MAG: hypothetical protein QM698_05775 [Micropepsaceae bacterium]
MIKDFAVRATLVAPVLMLGVATPARAGDDPTDICPAIVVDNATRNAAYYPPAQSRNRRDFSHIAVILSATASCVENDDDQIVATVSVTYAVEAGTLYRGGANVKIKAALTNNGAPVLEAENAKETVLTPGTPATVTNTIAGILVGEDDAVEDGGFTLTVGLVP